jgi:hypothetical protein
MTSIAKSSMEETEIREFAEELLARMPRPDWVDFYREVFGLHGIIRRSFPKPKELAKFERSKAFKELQWMLDLLRRQGPVARKPDEPTQVLTVRIPKSMHDSLRVEAHEKLTTLNKLCISKLLQTIDGEKIPTGLEEIDK